MPNSKDSSLFSEVFKKQRLRSLEQRKATVAERRRILRELETFLLKEQERITRAIFADFSKPFAEIALSEFYPVITEIRHAVDHLEKWARPTKVDAPLTFLGTRSEIRYEPKGVCLIISPWNYPFSLCFGPLVSCIAAGNTAILKPSEMTPSCSGLIAALVREFFKDDLVMVVEGGPDVTTELLRCPFNHIFFTGSPEVGKIVMKAAAENLTSVTLELGGKSPVIVGKSANIKDAAKRIAFGKFINNGQTCIAPDYLLVEESIKDELVAALKEQVTKQFGDGNTVGMDSGSYARIVNKKHFARLNGLIEDSLERGAKQVLGGAKDEAQRFIHPVILSDVSAESKVMKEEIFGPVLPVISFRATEEVIDKINNAPKPLALYIFGTDVKFREKILRETSAGSVCVNDCVIQFAHPNLPFGGVNNSGIGKSHGYFGFLSFSNEKPVVRQKSGFTMLYSLYPPYSAKVKRTIDLMIKWF